MHEYQQQRNPRQTYDTYREEPTAMAPEMCRTPVNYRFDQKEANYRIDWQGKCALLPL